MQISNHPQVRSTEMQMRIGKAVLVAGLCAMAPLAIARAQATQLTCKDGTKSSATGRGACSSHGGVAGKETAATKMKSPTAKTAVTKSQPKPAAGTESKAPAKKPAANAESKAATKTAAKSESKTAKSTKKSDVAAAKVTCVDGSMSAGGRGACSGHGGIKKQ